MWEVYHIQSACAAASSRRYEGARPTRGRLFPISGNGRGSFEFSSEFLHCNDNNPDQIAIDYTVCWLYIIAMSGPYIPDARDHEVASLRRRIQLLEEELKRTSGVVVVLDGSSGRMADGLRMMTDYMEDVLTRLGKVEKTVYPKLTADLEHAHKLIGPGGDGSEFRLDRGAPQKPK
jgi:hypothetical protein